MTSAAPEPYAGRGCPLCARTGGVLVHQIATLPVHSCLLMDTRADALDVHRGSLDLVLCDSCGYLANRAFDDALTAYSPRYEDSQAFSKTFVAYAEELARDWVTHWDLSGREVVEIGAGRGDFSRMLAAAGAARVVAMDPTIDLARFGTGDPRVEPLVEQFDATSGLPACDAVVMRHVLEHVDDPVALLTALRAALDGRPDMPVLVEIPDAARILTEGAFWDVYYEHCAYLTTTTVRELFESCGFEIHSIDIAYDGQYLLVAALPSGAPRTAGLSANQLDVQREKALQFGESVGQELLDWRRRLAKSRASAEEVVVWGSGSKGTAFLVAMADAAAAVGRVVDVNPHLEGRFVAGTGHPIVAPGDLGRLGCDLVVVMNPVYLDEIEAAVNSLSPGAEVIALGR